MSRRCHITFHSSEKNSKRTFWVLEYEVVSGRILNYKQQTLTPAILNRKNVIVRKLWTSLHNLEASFKNKDQKSRETQRSPSSLHHTIETLTLRYYPGHSQCSASELFHCYCAWLLKHSSGLMPLLSPKQKHPTDKAQVKCL